MSNPDPKRDKALDSLDKRLQAFETKRAGSGSLLNESGISEGYRLLSALLGGVLGGLGLGWFLDRFAHTAPFGLIGGLLIGTGLGIYSVVRVAGRMSDQAAAKTGPAPPAPADDEDE